MSPPNARSAGCTFEGPEGMCSVHHGADAQICMAELGRLLLDIQSGRRRVGDPRPIEELIEESSLGTPAAKAVRERTPPEVADEIVRRTRRDHSDPRPAGGAIAGPGGPHDRNAVVIDMTDAILLDDIHVALVERERGGVPIPGPVIALQLAGRINKTQERSKILYVFDADGAAGLVTELLALGNRAGFGEELLADVMRRLDELAKSGALGPLQEGSR